MLRIGQHAVLMLAVSMLPPSRKSIHSVIAGLVVGITAQLLLGFYELASGATVFYSRWKPIEAATWNGMMRVASTPADPNYFALGLVAMLPLIVWAATCLDRRFRILLMALGVTCLALLMLTFSRAGYIGALLYLAILVWRSRASQRGRTAVGFALALGVGILLFGDVAQVLASRILTLAAPSADASISVRVGAQLAALRVFIENPLTGIGFDRFVAVGPSYLFDVSGISMTEVNALNSYLLVAAEGGAAALIPYLGGITWAWYRLAVSPSDGADPIFVGLRIAVADSLIVWSLVSLSLDGLHSPIQWILLGLASLVIRVSGTSGNHQTLSMGQ
jgi:O-antigen ligase